MKADVSRVSYRPKESASNRPPPAEWTHRVACHGRRATSPNMFDSEFSAHTSQAQPPVTLMWRDSAGR